MSSAHVGIEFGNGQLRAAAVERDGTPVITAVQGFNNIVEADAAAVLKSFVTRAKLAGANATFSVPSDLAMLHWTKLPNVSLDEMHDIALFKLREHFAKDMSDLALGLVPFEQGADETVETLAIAVPKEIVANRAALVEKADLNPTACEIEAQSLLRIAQRELSSVGALFNQMSMTIVDLGVDRTRFVVVQNRRVQFIRTVKFGANRLVKVVADALEVLPDHAQILVDQRSTYMDTDLSLNLQKGEDWVRVDVTSAMESLFKELRRLTTYFRTLRSDRSYRGLMERLVLSGELVHIEGFSDGVGKSIGIGTQELNPLYGARMALPPPDLACVANTPHRFTVAIGHALSTYSQSNQEEPQDVFASLAA